MDYTKYSKAELLTLCQVYKAKITYLESVSEKGFIREFLLAGICEFTKRDTQKDILEVEEWIKNQFIKTINKWTNTPNTKQSIKNIMFTFTA